MVECVESGLGVASLGRLPVTKAAVGEGRRGPVAVGVA
jgi:hypothetical protein